MRTAGRTRSKRRPAPSEAAPGPAPSNSPGRGTGRPAAWAPARRRPRGPGWLRNSRTTRRPIRASARTRRPRGRWPRVQGTEAGVTRPCESGTGFFSTLPERPGAVKQGGTTAVSEAGRRPGQRSGHPLACWAMGGRRMRCTARLQGKKSEPASRLRPGPVEMDCRPPEGGSQCNPFRRCRSAARPRYDRTNPPCRAGRRSVISYRYRTASPNRDRPACPRPATWPPPARPTSLTRPTGRPSRTASATCSG